VGREDFRKISAEIRTRAIPAGPAGLAPDTPPSWYEVLPTGSLDEPSTIFKRLFALDRVEDWKKREEITDAYRLVVYEFGDGREAQPIRVSDPATDRRVYVMMQRVDQWPIGLRRLQDEATPNP
jgi:hypothetical protein